MHQFFVFFSRLKNNNNNKKSWINERTCTQRRLCIPKKLLSNTHPVADSAVCLCICLCELRWIRFRWEMCDVILSRLLEALAPQVDGCIFSEHTNTRAHTHAPTHAHTHTAGMLGCWIWPSILADGLGATLSVTIVTCSLFPLSLCLSLPVSSAKRRKMADKILPQRVRLHIFTFVVLLCFSACLSFLSPLCKTEEKTTKTHIAFWCHGILGKRRGLDHYLLFPTMGRERTGGVMRSFLQGFYPVIWMAARWFTLQLSGLDGNT